MELKQYVDQWGVPPTNQVDTITLFGGVKVTGVYLRYDPSLEGREGHYIVQSRSRAGLVHNKELSNNRGVHRLGAKGLLYCIRCVKVNACYIKLAPQCFTCLCFRAGLTFTGMLQCCSSDTLQHQTWNAQQSAAISPTSQVIA